MPDLISPSGAKLIPTNRLYAIMADGTKLDLGEPQLALVKGVLRIVSSRKMLTNGLIVAVVLETGGLVAAQRLADPVPMVVGQTFTGRIDVPVVQPKPPKQPDAEA